MSKIKSFLLMTLGTILITAEVYFFEIPNDFAIGGVTGIGVILGKFTPLSPETWIFILNILLLIIGFIFLGKECGFRTIYCSLLYSGLTKLLEWVLPLDHPLTSQPLLELICVLFLLSIGGALLFYCNATSGGTDILAMILKKYTSLDVGKAILVVDLFVVLSSFFTFGMEIGLFSLVGLIFRAFFTDSVIENFHICKYFTIITTKPDEITHFILDQIDRGATIVQGEGAYTGETKAVIHTVVRRFEAVKLQKAVHEIDPDAFVIVTSSSEIIGSGFRDI